MEFSYSLWRDFSPQLGLEEFHCHKKRGLSRAKKIKQQDTNPQLIGKLAQRGIAYLYKHPEFLSAQGIKYVGNKVLNLQNRDGEVAQTIQNILELYFKYPFLQNKNVIHLDSGDQASENIILPIDKIYLRVNYLFDCVIEEESRIHIVDFKTGKTQDIRQAFVYILVGDNLYFNYEKEIVASFYNLETAESSDIYSLDPQEKKFVKQRILEIAVAHKREMKDYDCGQKSFENIFPASPGRGCLNCSYQFYCEDYVEYVNDN
ncbi:MAG: hypothetical protein EWV41_16005 [Microcystis wesenbergii Mw_MB_S_20031200_S109]|uniref:PD-(D/E)XK endonuclease-like domain-containing protein n=1 Tax=Microcystis wesenbergii Mw_MB_S_20031200_S109D TaxID=2486241 RepID=A0A552LSB7_9CHRO|nr:MAG: hypothetical protein EWV41_16005 [Microcystis wesenbergii Mw_MB_S_20031200_S109]TRV23125.1 MAG: hypothetical protein EWV88_12215 [Microcystis wesenbergii Mw_MB_S_20031200_S109D]